MEQETQARNPRTDSKKEQRCTAPHPALSFVYFLGTLALGLMAAYLLWKSGLRFLH
jgi:hypothetical protein